MAQQPISEAALPTPSIPAPDQAQSIRSNLDVPAVIPGSVNLLAFAGTLRKAVK